jgi:hypothetical protein
MVSALAVDDDERIEFMGAVPVYIGTGVRITTEVNAITGNINLGSLPAVTAAVSANEANGTISVGSMGITGDSIGLMIQQPVNLSEASVESAMQSVGAIKASIAAAASASNAAGNSPFRFHPQVIGFEFFSRNPKIIEAVRAHVTAAEIMIVKATPVEIKVVQANTITGLLNALFSPQHLERLSPELQEKFEKLHDAIITEVEPMKEHIESDVG